MLAVWLWLSSSGGATASAAARVALTASPRHDHSRASVGRAQWRLRAADRLRAVYRRVVESSGGATASAVARAAWAAPPRHAHSRASVGRARGRSRVAERSRAVRRRVVDGFQAVGSGVAPAVARAASASSPRRARLGSSAGCATHSPVANDCAISCCRAVADGAERVRVVGEGALPSSLGTAPDVRVRVEPLVAVRAAMQASEAARATPVKGVAAVAGSVRTPVWDVQLWSTGWQMYVNRVNVCCVRGLASDATCACAVRTRGSECCCWGEARTRCVPVWLFAVGSLRDFPESLAEGIDIPLCASGPQPRQFGGVCLTSEHRHHAIPSYIT